MPRPLLLAASMLLATGIGACSGGEEQPTGTVTDTAAVAADTLNVLGQLTVADVLQSDERFSAFVAALDTAGIMLNLEQQGPFTVFVPPDASFSGAARSLVAGADRSRLLDVLQYHILDVNLTVEELRRRDSLSAGTLEGTPVSIYRTNGRYVVNGVPLANTSVTVRNGTVYVLNGALTPPSAVVAQAPATRTPRSSSQSTARSPAQSTPRSSAPRSSTLQRPPQTPPRYTPPDTPEEPPEPL